jgi:hypothetical protein
MILFCEKQPLVFRGGFVIGRDENPPAGTPSPAVSAPSSLPFSAPYRQESVPAVERHPASLNSPPAFASRINPISQSPLRSGKSTSSWHLSAPDPPLKSPPALSARLRRLIPRPAVLKRISCLLTIRGEFACRKIVYIETVTNVAIGSRIRDSDCSFFPTCRQDSGINR